MKKIVFITGTRADFGKIKSLIRKVDSSENFKCYVFVTGVHMLSRYGSTWEEIAKEKYKNVFYYINQSENAKMDLVVANTIIGFNHYVNEIKPDLVVVHGDRVEPLAVALVSAFNNILLAHIEGGEVSGTIDESIRHAISKLAHLHFVANDEAKVRLMRMGEPEDRIFLIGSPDIDIMLSKELPTLDEAKKYYEIPFEKYHIFMYHPVTTEIIVLNRNIAEVVRGLKKSRKNFIVIYPNNDEGSDVILHELVKLMGNKHFRVLPSLRFEYFLTLLKHARSIVGNSSAGIREAEVYGVQSINIGTRQRNRSKNGFIIHISEDATELVNALASVGQNQGISSRHFGDGRSTEKFFDIISNEKFFLTDIQKVFSDFS